MLSSNYLNNNGIPSSSKINNSGATRGAQKSCELNNFGKSLASAYLQEEYNSNIEVLTSYLNLCKACLSISRILGNSNFDKRVFNLGIAEKMSFLLLKHALCRLNIIQDRMFIGGENILWLTEWQSFKNSGRYTEIST